MAYLVFLLARDIRETLASVHSYLKDAVIDAEILPVAATWAIQMRNVIIIMNTSQLKPLCKLLISLLAIFNRCQCTDKIIFNLEEEFTLINWYM